MIKLKETVEWPEDYSERFDCTINLRKALNWIKKHFVESKTLTKSTSYGFKHMLESDLGGYISNYAFKMLMLEAGFKAEDYTVVNWRFYAKYVESN